MMMRKNLAGAGILIALLVAGASTAMAQAAPPRYQSSDPARGATLHQAPERVEVTFDQPLDENSSLAVVDECDRRLDDGSTDVNGSSMSIGIETTPSGAYHVEYRARGIAGITGESEGHFTFTVHAGKSCKGGGGHHHDDDDDDHGGRHDDHKKGREHDDHKGDHDDEHGTHVTGSTHDDHTTGTDHEAGHGTGNHGGNGHENHKKNVAAGGDVPGITSTSDTARKLLSNADSTALIAALALCVLLGVVGGAVLRASAAR